MMRIIGLLFFLAFAATFPASASEMGAELDRGAAAHKNGDVTAAIKIFTKLADGGVSRAQYNLGVIYASGKGVPRDYKTSAKWYRLAADRGHVEAQFNLGIFYANGSGVPKNFEAAFKYYRLAAEQGMTDAQFNVGLWYARGQGTAEDLVQGYKWLAIAAAKGDEQAVKIRDLVRDLMDPADLLKAKKLFRYWMSQHPG